MTEETTNEDQLGEEKKALLARIINAFINIREKRSVLKREFDQADGVLRKNLDFLEAKLLAMMNEIGSDQLTVRGLGMAIRTTNYRAEARDWKAITEYITESGDIEVLQRRLALGHIREFQDAHGHLPPGIDLTAEIAVTVRRN